ncbi:MAG TPA: hypothetical protein VNZ45_11415 [Bacteroidia bacterium]|jgi:hypothetical protein|nr:hypothetical protein [Bacteroidia bacterium]
METNQVLVSELLKEKKRLAVLLKQIDGLLSSYTSTVVPESKHVDLPVVSDNQQDTTEKRFAAAVSNPQKTLIALERIGKGDISKIAKSWAELDSSISDEEIRKRVYPSIFALREQQQKIEVVPSETGENGSSVYRIRKVKH